MVKGISDVKYAWRKFLWSKVLAVFLFLKVRVTKVIRKKGTNEVHPASDPKKRWSLCSLDKARHIVDGL